jgi:hypothetical protein
VTAIHACYSATIPVQIRPLFPCNPEATDMSPTFLGMTPDLLYQCVYAGLILTPEEREALANAAPVFSRAAADAELMRADYQRQIAHSDDE